MELRDKDTGEVIKINSFDARLGYQRKRVRAFCELMEDKRVDFLMICLTYVDQAHYCDRDLTNFIKRLMRHYPGKVLGYTWVAEVQRRGYAHGGLHFHLVLVVPKGFKIALPDKTGLWTKGSTRVELARTVWYVCKYTGKEYQKRGLPKYCHMFAVWLSHDLLTKFEHWCLKCSTFPAYVMKVVRCKAEWVLGDVDIGRAKGGGYWIDNMWFPSPYVIISF
jgi:hypothetical protein